MTRITVTKRGLALFILISFLFACMCSGADQVNAAKGEKEVTSKAYIKKSMTELIKAKKLGFPKEMKDVEIKDNASGDGIIFSGKVKDLTSGKIEIKDDFDFNENPVGRISFDGLADRGKKCIVGIYLDDNEEPEVEFELKSQMGKKPWASKGDRTAGVLDKGIKGKHKVYIGLDFPDEKGKKKTEVLLQSVEFAENSLPVLYFDIDEKKGTIDAMNGSPDHSVECYGDVTIEVPKGYKSEYTDKKIKTKEGLELEYIRGRGNSTWMTDKKPYKVKFDKKQDLFGMGKNKHWVLLANRYDNSFMRNKITYWLGEKLGMEFTPKSVPVEVVMNDQYYGSYFLSEQIRVGETRVNVDDLEDTEELMKATDFPTISGGYLVSMESADEGSKYNDLTTKRGVQFYLESPEFSEHKNDTQRDYIKKYLQKVESTIFSKKNKDKHGDSYRKYIDRDSIVNYWWLQEFSANGDAFISGSTYLYKKRKGKLYFGPLWDFDFVAWGDLEYDSEVPEGLTYTSMLWIERLKQNRFFAKKLVEKWPELRSYLKEITREGGLLDQYYEELKVSRQYDVSKWGKYGGDDFWDGILGLDILVDEELMAGTESNVPDTYKGEVEQLRTWIDQRIEKVDEAVDDLTPKKNILKFKAKGKLLKKKGVYTGNAAGKLPKAPKKKGYIFEGWKNKEYGILQPGDAIYKSMTFKASYIKKTSAEPAEALYFKSYYVCQQFDSESDVYPTEYTVKPEGATASIVWKSSDKTIATVDSNGDVKAKKPGIVTITARVRGGGKKLKRSYKLWLVDTDKRELNEITGIRAKRKVIKVKKGGYKQFRIATKKKPCYSGDINFISMDPKIASVDQNGVITGKKKGVTYVLAHENEYDFYKKCKVVVKGGKSAGKKSKAALIREKKKKAQEKKEAKILAAHAKG